MKTKKIMALVVAAVLAALLMAGCGNSGSQITGTVITTSVEDSVIEEVASTTYRMTTLEDAVSCLPDFNGEYAVTLNGDVPYFTEEEKQFAGTFITLSELDSLGRCGTAFACVGQETEPDEERGDISHVHPSGWNQLQLSDGSYLYNRSHLLMFALTGLNDDERNLITGTARFNAGNEGSMLAYETGVKQAVDEFNCHILYRVTPVYDGDNLVAKAVIMEAYNFEYPDDEYSNFCVAVYNVQDGVKIDYATGMAEEVQ